MCLGKILLKHEQSGPFGCGQKSEEPGNEKGDTQGQKWSPKARRGWE